MKKDKHKDLFLRELEKTPIVQVACDRIGISRNSVYRWRKEDLLFSKRMEESLEIGTDLVNDVAESNILTGIKNGDSIHTRYWLSHRHKNYRRRFVFDAITSQEEKKIWDEKVIQAKKRLKRLQGKWFKNN